MRSYLSFLARNPRFLTFGTLAAFFSSFGQTFFIALFGGAWRAEFELSHGGYGSIYSAATLMSGACLIWLGKKIDRVDLRHYTVFVCLGLTAACLFTAVVSSAWMLVPAFFALRLTGQGLMSHVSNVAMARYFQLDRGKAISIASLGHPLGEAILPTLAVLLIGALGWRFSWGVFGGLLLIGLIPLMLWLLRGHGAREQARQNAAAATEANQDAHSWSLRQVLRDPVFYPVIICMLAPPFITTGLFFHQVHLAETKGWSLEWLATCFAGFAGAQVLASLIAGALADRTGAIRMLPFYLPTLGLAALVLAVFDHPAAAAVYLFLAGLTGGANFILLGAVFAELYGTGHLGGIRSVVQACMVFATAGAPALFGWLLDADIGFEALTVGCTLYVAGAVLLLALLQMPLRARAAQQTAAKV
ncbi:MFS transporter [Rhodovibrio salinarum]|uniref:MFS transporter n=1 Tax=Rhodovibrio salinarum TaxID=1087 RepID=UPI0004AFC3A5|nr:MFS transporter [Rhodovibrio salinarum]